MAYFFAQETDYSGLIALQQTLLHNKYKRISNIFLV